MNWTLIAAQLPQQLVNGLTLGFVYALIALGYTLVYGILELLNFAHGDVYMVGAFIGLGVITLLVQGGHALVAPLLIVFVMGVASVVGTSLLGVTIERFAYRPLRNSSRLAPLISALGVSIFLENLFLLAFGAQSKSLPTVALFPPAMGFDLGSARVDLWRAVIVGASIVIMIGMYFWITRTRFGKAIRATAEDREAAAFMGIDVDRVISLTFLVGSALAGIAGVLVALLFANIDFSIGYLAGLKAFTAAVLGGIGNIQGALLGGVLLGLVESLSVAFIGPAYKDVVTFLVLILALLIKPSGLLGQQLPAKV
ncbi:MAG TPA: branched-chain amino acid ABC transporter permease [Chloroflexota bacterium]|nr:branched-chain amino acid ABC transporter permease [Chloroflexota bacterium]